MSEEEFLDAAALKAWLATRGVSEEMAAKAAPALYDGGFTNSFTLVEISADALRAYVHPPVAQYLSNKLKQRQDGKLRC